MGTRKASTKIRLSVEAQITNTLSDSQVAAATMGIEVINATLATGVSASQGNRAWEDKSRALTSGSVEEIDLADLDTIDIGAGAAKDALGQSWTAEEIVTIIIAQTAGPGRLEIMPSLPSHAVAWMPSLTVANGGALRNGGVLMMHQPDTQAFPITDNSSNDIKLGANGGAIEYYIFLLARHDSDESSSSQSSSVSSSSVSSSSASSSSECSTSSSASTNSSSSVSSSSSCSSLSSITASSSSECSSASSISSRTLSSSSVSSRTLSSSSLSSSSKSSSSVSSASSSSKSSSSVSSESSSCSSISSRTLSSSTSCST